MMLILFVAFFPESAIENKLKAEVLEVEILRDTGKRLNGYQV